MISRRSLMRAAAWLALAAPSLAGARSPPPALRRRCASGSSRSSGASPVIVLDKEGWAKQAGLELNFITFESGPNMIQALASGTLDVYVAGVAPLAVARAKGVDVKVVTATAVEEIVMVAGPEARQLLQARRVGAARRWRRSQGNEGKAARLATQPAGSVPNTTLQHWLWEVGEGRQGRMPKSCPWASTRPSRRCSRARSTARRCASRR